MRSYNRDHQASFYLSNRPEGPSKQQLEQALQPCEVYIDQEAWQQAHIEYKNRPRDERKVRKGQPSQQIIRFYEGKIQQPPFIMFNTISNPARCPRRYPVHAPSVTNLLLDTKTSKKLKNKIFASSLPREFRKAIRIPQSGLKVHGDFTACHPSFLGSLSGDQNMLDAVENDFHQRTGDIFGSSIPEAAVRRNLGKSINSAMIAGAGADWIEHKLETLSNKPGLDKNNPNRVIDVRLDTDPERNKSLILERFLEWWSPFEVAAEYKRKHNEHIRHLCFLGKPYKIRWGGRTMLNIDASTLAGFSAIPDWPDDISARKAKAEQSAFTGLLRCYEAAIMDQIFVEAHKCGMQLILPLFDGAMWFCPNHSIACIHEFEENVQSIIQSWGIEMAFEIKTEENKAQEQAGCLPPLS
jgi:hypothetical protein